MTDDHHKRLWYVIAPADGLPFDPSRSLTVGGAIQLYRNAEIAERVRRLTLQPAAQDAWSVVPVELLAAEEEKCKKG